MYSKVKKNRFMNVVFYLRRDLNNSNRLSVIYWYLSYNGQRSKKYSTGVRVDAKFWRKSYVTGENAKPINDALNNIRADLTDLFNAYKDAIVSIQEIADIYNNNQEHITVLSLYDDLTDRKSSENWSDGTIKSYKSFRRVWLAPYCNSVSTPFYAHTFRPKHLEELASKMREHCKEEFIRKSLSKVKAAFNLGFAMEKIKTNPLNNYRLFYAERDKKEYVYLTPNEIESLENLKFSNKETHLELARDLFLIQCYTSLSFNELIGFDANEHYKETDNWKWILQKRGKTDVLQQIPLLPKAEKLLQKLKFKLNPSVNHRYNEYIRICAYRARIDKHLHSHLGRISCGAFLLNSGISLEVVSRVLGHTNINQTERVYARILDNWRVKDEFTKVFPSQEPQVQQPPQNPFSTTQNFGFTYSYSK